MIAFLAFALARAKSRFSATPFTASLIVTASTSPPPRFISLRATDVPTEPEPERAVEPGYEARGCRFHAIFDEETAPLGAGIGAAPK